MIDGLLNLVTKFVPDTDKAKELEAQVQEAHSKALTTAVEADKEIRLASLKKGGLAAVWRPICAMMTFATLFLYHFVYPLAYMIITMADLDMILPMLPELPTEYYGLSIAFISIYAYGRSQEKRSQ